MDRRSMKELTRMGKKMDYGLAFLNRDVRKIKWFTTKVNMIISI